MLTFYRIHAVYHCIEFFCKVPGQKSLKMSNLLSCRLWINRTFCLRFALTLPFLSGGKTRNITACLTHWSMRLCLGFCVGFPIYSEVLHVITMNLCQCPSTLFESDFLCSRELCLCTAHENSNKNHLLTML